MKAPDTAAADWELWGVFSPADHLRRRPFVAEVLIYDRLVVPVPDEREEDLLRKWERRWDPALQATLLDVIDAERPDLVRRVPWTAQHDYDWRAHAEAAGLRVGLAHQTSRDVDIIQGVDPANPNSLGQLGERTYLVDEINSEQDQKMRSSVPPGAVTAVAAFGSHRLFSREVPVQPASSATIDQTPLDAFSWPLMVPSSSARSDIDLLKEATELATSQETVAYRRHFHQWRRSLLSSTDPKQAAEELNEIIDRYHAATRKARLRTRLRIAVMVVVAGAGGAVGALPPEVILPSTVGAAGLGKYLDARVLSTSIPDYQFAGALFHEARERFDWYR